MGPRGTGKSTSLAKLADATSVLYIAGLMDKLGSGLIDADDPLRRP